MKCFYKFFTSCLMCIAVGVFIMPQKSYCYEYILNDSDIQTICDNNFGVNTTWSNLFYERIKALKDEFYSYNYDVIIINMQSNPYHQVDVFGTASSRIASVNNLNNKNYMEITMQGNGIRASIVQNGYNSLRVDRSGLSSPNTYPVGSGAQNRSNYLMYTNDLGSSVTGPYENLAWLNFQPPILYEIELNTDTNTNYFNITTEFGNTISNIPVIYENPFGTFYDNTYIYYIADTLTMWYFDGSSWREKTIFHQVKDRVLLSDNTYMSYYYTEGNDFQEAILTLNDLYKYYNVVYHYQITNNQLDEADAFFLFGNSNTSISNGSIDTSNFGSDYLDQFKNLDNMINDNNNTQDLINEINDNNDFWKNTYDNLFAMDSGDVNDIFTTIQSYISSGDSPIGFYNVLFDSLSDDPTDFVISWNNIPVRLTLFNGQEVFSGDLISGNRINFSESCRENETLATILNWVRIFNVLFFITSYLYTIYTCILVILGISLTFVDPPEPEHRQIGFINDWRDK